MKITERGWPSHHCLGYRCIFRRNTLIQHNRQSIVIVTIGKMINDDGRIIVGHDRYYETMAYLGHTDNGYIEADVRNKIDFKSPWFITTYTNKSDLDADNMHDNVVDELRKRLLRGEKFKPRKD